MIGRCRMSVSMKTRQAYSEIDEFIGLLTVNKQNEIPKKLRDFFKEQKDKEYVKNINPNIPIKEQNLLEETLALIAMLNLQYWCKDEQEKERLKNIYAENERKYQDELREKYNPDNLFKKQKSETLNLENNTITEETAIIEYKEKNFLQKIFDKIKHLFKKN